MKGKKITAEQFEKARQAMFDTLPDLDEHVKDWVERSVLGYSRYMFTFKEDGVYFGYCTHCGITRVLEFKRPHNESGICPSCGNLVKFKDAWRGHKYLVDTEYIVVAQPLKDKGIAIRSFWVKRISAEIIPTFRRNT